MLIETNRCLIREFSEENLDDFISYRNDGCWMQYQGFKGLTKQEFRKALLGAISFQEGAQLAITDKASSRLIGDLYLKQEGNAFWIGYTVGPANAGRGYAFEAACGAVEWIRENGFDRVLAAAEPENTPSVNLLKKLGFESSGVDENGEALYTLNLRSV